MTLINDLLYRGVMAKRMEDRTAEEWADLMSFHAIPRHCREGLHAHITTGRAVGHFLTAMLEGDLFEACARADRQNEEALGDYARFLFNCAPRGCFGSPAAVARWREAGGLSGLQRADAKGTPA